MLVLNGWLFRSGLGKFRSERMFIYAEVEGIMMEPDSRPFCVKALRDMDLKFSFVLINVREQTNIISRVF